MQEIQGKHLDLSVDHPQQLRRVAHALSSPVRIQVMQALGKRSMNVGELAQELDIPMSTTALAIKVLEEAGIITCEAQPGARGSMKLCSRKIDTMSVEMRPEIKNAGSAITMQMPIGGYSTAQGIRTTCGIASEKSIVGEMDNPAVFYVPERFGAQLIWFRQGMLEYRFAHTQMRAIEVDWLEVSFEACSEAPMHRDPWPSDIVVSINGKRLGVWTCPCDCGGRHGRLTPAWWPDLSTQYGFLKTWRVTREGSYLDNVRIGDTKVSDLNIEGYKPICVTIEVPEDVQNAGGINLFGERFGDYPQGIVMNLGYKIKTEE